MAPTTRLPTDEEMAYAGSFLKGRKKLDLAICLVATALGVCFGVSTAVTSGDAAGPDGIKNLAFYAVACGGALFICALVLVYSVRSIIAMGAVWRPVRYMTWVAVAYALVSLGRALLSLARGAGWAGVGFVLLMLPFGILLFCIAMHIVLFVRSAVVGVDDDAALARRARGEDGEDAPK